MGLTDQVLPVGAVYDWCLQANCGAVVLFSGTVRDHALDEQVVPAFEAIVAELRQRWPDTGRVVVLHRTGRLSLMESSVLAAVSAPHRPEAFEAARFAIDALKASAPIWKHEVWSDGSDWGANAHDLIDPSEVTS